MATAVKLPARRVRLSEARIRDMKAPLADRVYVFDTATPGLCVCVTAAGSKSMYLYRRVAGRPERVRLGGWPELSVEESRKAASVLIGRVASGADLRAERRAQREAATFGAFLDAYLDGYAAFKKSGDQDVRQARYLAPLRGLRLRDVTTKTLASVVDPLRAEHPHAANNLRAMVVKIYRWATAERGYSGPNPALALRRARVDSRARYMTEDESQRLVEAIRAEPEMKHRVLFWMAIETGARRGNICRMKWEQLNLIARVWTVPGTEFKTGRTVRLPLTRRAVAILRSWRKHAPESDFVFPSRWMLDKPLQEPGKIWVRVRERAKLNSESKDLRVIFHDIRRTMATNMILAGVPLPTVGAALGHSPNSPATFVYARTAPSAVAAALTAASDAIRKASRAKP